MPNFNKLVIIGHLTRTPELKTVGNGTTLCKTGIAYNDRRKKAHFFDVVAFGKTAELIANSFEKGDAVGFEGEMTIDEWQGKDGQKRQTPTVVAQSVIFLGQKRESQQGQGSGYAQNLPDDDGAPY